MSLTAIREKILAEADSKAAEIRQAADEEARKILSDAKAKAKEIEQNASKEAESESKTLEMETSAGLEMERSALILEAKAVVVDKAYQKVRKELRGIIEKEYLMQMLKSGAKQFSAATDGAFVVKTSKKYAKMVEGLKLRPKYEDIDGFVLESIDGKMRLNLDPDSMIERKVDEIRANITEALFGKAISKPKERKAPPIKIKVRARKAKPKRKR